MSPKRPRWIAPLALVALLWLLEIAIGRRRNHPNKPTIDDETLRTRMRAEEYRSLREEINATLKRGFEIHFAALTISVGLLGYGVTVEEWLISTLIILSPILILHLGFLLILEQVRTVRRNAAYIRIFHEGPETGIFWETRLYKLRQEREQEEKDKKTRTTKKDVTVADILKGFPTIVDIISAICLAIAWVKITMQVEKVVPLAQWPIEWWIGGGILIVALPITLLVVLARSRHHKSTALQGGGTVEKEYANIWRNFQQEDQK